MHWLLINTVSSCSSSANISTDKSLVYPRNFPKTGAPDDETSFVASQEYWGKERANRPDVLFQLYAAPGRITLEPGLLFTPTPSKEFPQLQVVIDRDGKPMRNIPELPIKISTSVEGWLVEAWVRSNPSIKHDDIMQRMIHLNDQKWARRNAPGGFKNTISGRRRDFRKLGKCLSWEHNSAHRSAFDLQVIDEVRSNQDWARDGTTRHLVDLDTDGKEALEEASKRKRTRAEDDSEDEVAGPSTTKRQKPGGSNIFEGPLIETDPPVDFEAIEEDLLVRSSNLLTGDELVAWFAERGVSYQPSHRLRFAAPGQQDARFTDVSSVEDRRQLFLALYQAVIAVAPFIRRPITVDLSTSYASAYNSLQDQLVHASYMDDATVDLAQVEQMLSARPRWAGEIGDFDVAGLPAWQQLDIIERERTKIEDAPHQFSPAFAETVWTAGLVHEQDRTFFWPDKVVVDASTSFYSDSGWIIELVDYE